MQISTCKCEATGILWNVKVRMQYDQLPCRYHESFSRTYVVLVSLQPLDILMF